MRKLWRRIHFLLHRRRMERELTDEMDAHREMMAADRRPHFGNATRLQEDSREVWSWPWLEQVWQDLCYGARVLGRAPAFTLGAIAVLALGVGVNLIEFQIFDAMMFHRLDIRSADSVLQFSRVSRQGRRPGFPYGAVEFYRTRSRSFDWLVAEEPTYDVIVDGAALRATLVSPNYFASLGLVPAWGRLLDAQDSLPGAAPVVVLEYDHWRTHYGADPDVIGRDVRINNRPVRVVGVLPYGFARNLFGGRTEVWFPVSMRPLVSPAAPPLQQDFSRASEALFGNLKAGVSLAAGEAELTSLTRELAREQPQYFRDDERLDGRLVQESILGNIRHNPAIAIFFVMILLVLLSACANLGNMLVARGLAREREISVRIAIGAGRARVVRQLMTENLLLALLGAAASLAFGAAGGRLLLVALNPPFTLQLRMGWPILAAALALTIFSTIVFGLPSALQTVRANPRRTRLRQNLIGVQVAVSCLLLIASGVLAHNGIASASVDLAFDYRNMLVIYPQLYGRSLTGAAAEQKLDALTERFAGLPGVDGVTTAIVPPLGGRALIDTLPGLPPVYRNTVAPSYFAVFQLPVVRGRTFLSGEQGAVVVSESAARAVWPGQDPLGKLWRFAGAERAVVGVVKDSGANLLADAESVEAYLPIENFDQSKCAVIVHTRGDPAPLTRMVPGAAAALNEAVSVTLMRASREAILELYRRMVTVIGSLGAVASVLAAAGMFALVAFTVAQRRRELGIRMAIGAGPAQILAALFRQNVRPTVIGALAGVVLAVALSRLVRNQIPLQRHDTVDVVGFLAGLGIFVLIAFLATLSPAARALRIDPSVSLREE
jgi:predicted permease